MTLRASNELKLVRLTPSVGSSGTCLEIRLYICLQGPRVSSRKFVRLLATGPYTYPLTYVWHFYILTQSDCCVLQIDSIDPAFAPATGTPETGGWSTRELRTILRGLDGLKIVSADIVEVAPAYDTNAELTTMAAADVSTGPTHWIPSSLHRLRFYLRS